LLNACDEGSTQPPPARAITLLAAACPEVSAAQWAAASIGERDRALLRLRENLFGPRLEATAACPQCGERLELTFTSGDITAPPPPPGNSGRLSLAGYHLTWRPPATADLLAIGPTGGRADLLARCVEARRDSDLQTVPPADLPEPVSQALSQAMAQADPQADVRLSLECPACAHRWSAAFDILSFLWGELEDWALQTLREVHALASAYGWSERDILSLSLRRRRMYLDLLGY
jgi:hypothetical protein